MTFGPASADLTVDAFYLADGGIDNDQRRPIFDEEPVGFYERDGVIYEGRLP